VDHAVTGARGTHNVDVWVTFKYLDLEIKWLIECKFWQTPVPKAAVLTLQQIAQDIGADRAFLLSEIGFQSGAVKVTHNTNVTLTSLDDLRENAQKEILEAALVVINKRIVELDQALKSFMMDEEGRPLPYPGLDMDEILTASGAVLFLRLSIQQAFAHNFPITFPAVGDCTSVFNPDLETFVQNLTAAAADLSARVDSLKLRAQVTYQQAIDALKELIVDIQQLMSDADVALFAFEESDPSFEEARLRSLESMKAVGRTSERLKGLAVGNLRTELHSLMRLLFDTVYLQLAQPKIPASDWDKTKVSVSAALQKMKTLTV
jgi:hypothetical protein